MKIPKNAEEKYCRRDEKKVKNVWKCWNERCKRNKKMIMSINAEKYWRRDRS